MTQGEFGFSSAPPSDVVPDGRTPETALPVTVLNDVVRTVLERRFPPLWVRGEVGNWRTSPRGHRYFTLEDGQSRVDCVLFASDAHALPADPEPGMDVFAYGRPSLYPARGRFQLVVRKLEASGEGLWRLAFERIRARLAADGLLDPDRKRALPGMPGRVGVVTSRDGAALRDVLEVIRQRAPWTHVLVRPCRVQGDGAALDLRRALETLALAADLDVIIVTRGGGSAQDLWVFNDEALARSVAACPIPVVAAIGHEVDVTLAELVADRRASTPSAAAAAVVPDRAALTRRISGAGVALATGLRRVVGRGDTTVAHLDERLRSSARQRLLTAGSDLGALADRLEALSPLSTLGRGYAVPIDEDGTVLRRVADLPPGRRFQLRVVDGSAQCRVEQRDDTS